MKHTDFILSPITSILSEAVTACVGVGDGMGTSTIAEHIMQSLFLRMTGFQEQKMKCVCWELATYDYDYRYQRFKHSPLGECSNYREKNQVINDIVSCSKKIDASYSITDNMAKTQIIQSVITDMNDIVADSNLNKWQSRKYEDYKQIVKEIKHGHILVSGKNGAISLFQESKNGIGGGYKDLVFIYDKVYRHRNSCAHNTLSYQENLPTLNKLRDNDYIYDNYFLRYSILILIDKIVIALYKQYLSVMESI